MSANHSNMMRPLFSVIALGLLAATVACSKGQVLVVESYHVGPPNPTGFVAGAATQEITPYPGIPLGGHGPAGRIAPIRKASQCPP